MVSKRVILPNTKTKQAPKQQHTEQDNTEREKH